MTRTNRPAQSRPPVAGMVRVRLRGLPQDLNAAADTLGQIFHIARDNGNKPLKRETTAENFRYINIGIPTVPTDSADLADAKARLSLIATTINGLTSHSDVDVSLVAYALRDLALGTTTIAEATEALPEEWQTDPEDDEDEDE